MTVKNIIETFRSQLTPIYEEREVRQFIYILFETYLSWTKMQLYATLDTELPDEQTSFFLHALEELKTHKPIQYIISKTWFNGNEYMLTPDVLIPRQETEELCLLVFHDQMNSKYQDLSILDIGTGSGIIAIDLKLRFPYALVTAIDISEKSLSVAKLNADKHRCKIDFQKFDILGYDKMDESKKFDIIVSNPPYVLESESWAMQRNVIDFEPPVALFVPDQDPLVFYAAISDFALKHLIRPGNLYLEINERFGNSIRTMLLRKGFEKVEVIKDIHGKDRLIKAEVKPRFDDTSYWYADLK